MSSLIRMTAALVTFADDTTAYALVRHDSGAIVPSLPATYRTAGDVSSVVAATGKRYNLAAVPANVGNHLWKGTYTLQEIADKFGVSQTVVDGLIAFYNSEDDGPAEVASIRKTALTAYGKI